MYALKVGWVFLHKEPAANVTVDCIKDGVYVLRENQMNNKIREYSVDWAIVGSWGVRWPKAGLHSDWIQRKFADIQHFVH